MIRGEVVVVRYGGLGELGCCPGYGDEVILSYISRVMGDGYRISNIVAERSASSHCAQRIG